MMEIKQENEEKTTRRDGNNNNGNTLHSFVSTHHQTLGLDQNLQRQHQQARSPVNLSDRVTGSKSKPPTIHAVRYRECLKNHAANSGGNIFDGCGEFMPSGEEGSLEALKCAACDCHRNFHRKEIDGESSSQLRRSAAVMLNPLQLPPPLPSPTMMHHQKYSISMHTMSPSSAIVAPMNVAFGGGMSGGGATDQSSSEDLNVFHSSAADVVLQPPPPPPFALSKKRFRTKFTHERKDQMTEFAEKIEWRFQKQDEEEIERFCARVGIKRQVFKVWMHNNKNNALKNILKQQPDPPSSNAM